MKNTIQAMIIRALDTVLPPRCVATGALVDRQGMLSPEIWRGLEFISTPYCKGCGFPFEFTGAEDILCGACLEAAPHYSCARSALKYNDQSRDLILRFKHGDQTHIVRSFVPMLKAAGHEFLEQTDFIIPVPLHRWRLFRRRYNQSALIALALSRDTHIPVMLEGIQRIRATPPQSRLGLRERHKNVKSAFAVRSRCATKIAGKSVVLIDDVYTTGATVQECTKALLKAGAAQVNVLTIARVVKA